MPTPVRPQATLLTQLGRPPQSLGTPSPAADAAALVNELNAKWSQIAKFGVSRADGAWLMQLANHPSANSAVWKAIDEKLATTPATNSASALIGQVRAALAAKIAPAPTPGGDGFTTTPTGPGTPTVGPGGPAVVTPPTVDVITGTQTPDFAQPIAGAKLAAVWPAELADTVEKPQSLDLAKLKDVGAQQNRGVLGELTDVLDVFRYPKILNTAALFTETKEGPDGTPQQAPKPGLEALVARLQRPFSVGADRHLINLPELGGAKSQRIMYVGPSQKALDNLKTIAAYYTSRGVAIDKNMAHVVDAKGGPLMEAMQGEHGPQDGVTHGGIMEILNLDPEAGPLSAEQIKQMLPNLKLGRYDKPGDYGDPTAGTDPTYWFHALAFDPSTVEFEADVKPGQKEFAGWLHAAQLWRVMDIATVGFASQYPIAALKNYKNNPVEGTDATQFPPMLEKMARAFNAKAANAEGALEELKWFAEYCEEGKNATRAMGANVPVNQKSVDRGVLSAEALGFMKQMEERYTSVYRNADGSLDKAKMYANPEAGYELLLAEGYLTEDSMSELKQTGYNQKPFVLNADDLDGWMAFKPKGVESEPGKDGYGLPFKPVSMVGLARMVLASNLPRQELMTNFLQDLKAIQAGTDEAAKGQLNAVLAQAGAPNVEAFAAVAAAQFQAGVLENLKPMVFEKLRFNELNDDDKAEIESFWKKSVDVIKDPGMALNREALFAALEKLDLEMRTEVKVSLDGAEKRPFLYFPPNLIPLVARGVPGFGGVGIVSLGMGVNEQFRKDT